MNIDEIKLRGQIEALKKEIRDRHFRLTHGCEFHEAGPFYIDLQSAVKTARSLLDEIEDLYVELNELQPGHN